MDKMDQSHQHVSGKLTLTVTDNDETIEVRWLGVSIERNPTEFLVPILSKIIRRSSEEFKRVVLDFSRLEYMNSSTITPVVKILERASRGASRITVKYDASLNWQELTFSALKIFCTDDKRVDIISIK